MAEQRQKPLSREAAAEIAVAGLQFLADDPETLGRFLSLSGLGPGDLRGIAGDPGFLVGILEFLMSDETTLVMFAESRHIRPTLVAAARYALAGSIEQQ
jgi:hypothetical protein